ncbi:MAG: hypothetical protein LBR76_08755 [Oscillospiraceae bacterium]|nr:hypothetical protein [Oscillospiraceae bacterium]
MRNSDFEDTRKELLRIITLMAMQLALADHVVQDHMPRALQLLEHLKAISVETL